MEDRKGFGCKKTITFNTVIKYLSITFSTQLYIFIYKYKVNDLTTE